MKALTFKCFLNTDTSLRSLLLSLTTLTVKKLFLMSSLHSLTQLCAIPMQPVIDDQGTETWTFLSAFPPLEAASQPPSGCISQGSSQSPHRTQLPAYQLSAVSLDTITLWQVSKLQIYTLQNSKSRRLLKKMLK